MTHQNFSGDYLEGPPFEYPDHSFPSSNVLYSDGYSQDALNYSYQPSYGPEFGAVDSCPHLKWESEAALAINESSLSGGVYSNPYHVNASSSPSSSSPSPPPPPAQFHSSSSTVQFSEAEMYPWLNPHHTQGGSLTAITQGGSLTAIAQDGSLTAISQDSSLTVTQGGSLTAISQDSSLTAIAQDGNLTAMTSMSVSNSMSNVVQQHNMPAGYDHWPDFNMMPVVTANGFLSPPHHGGLGVTEVLPRQQTRTIKPSAIHQTPRSAVPPPPHTIQFTPPLTTTTILQAQPVHKVSSSSSSSSSRNKHGNRNNKNSRRSLQNALAISGLPSAAAAAAATTPGNNGLSPDSSYSTDNGGTPSFEAIEERVMNMIRDELNIPDDCPVRPLDTNEKRIAFIKCSRYFGISYRDIKVWGNLTEAESTLRGRHRTATKPQELRVRKPVWHNKDIALLAKAVEMFKERPVRHRNNNHHHHQNSNTAAVRQNGNNVSSEVKVSWKRVATYIWENGGTYQFGYSTCKKKWNEYCKEQAQKEARSGV